jgi:hypothetical protein
MKCKREAREPTASLKAACVTETVGSHFVALTTKAAGSGVRFRSRRGVTSSEPLPTRLSFAQRKAPVDVSYGQLSHCLSCCRAPCISPTGAGAAGKSHIHIHNLP